MTTAAKALSVYIQQSRPSWVLACLCLGLVFILSGSSVVSGEFYSAEYSSADYIGGQAKIGELLSIKNTVKISEVNCRLKKIKAIFRNYFEKRPTQYFSKAVVLDVTYSNLNVIFLYNPIHFFSEIDKYIVLLTPF